LKKKEEVCRLKSALKNYAKSGDGVKKGILRGKGVKKRNRERRKMPDLTFLKRKVDVLHQQRKRKEKS
jgi:hypothetical protein